MARVLPHGPRLLAALVLWSTTLLSAGNPAYADVDVGASLRQSALVLHWPTEAPLPEGSFGLHETRVRPFLRWDPVDALTFSAAIESQASFTSLTLPPGFDDLDSPRTDAGGSQTSLLGQSSPLRRFDLTWQHQDAPGASLQTSIERLDVLIAVETVDIRIGRQPISLGTSRFVGVLDVLAPFAPGDLDATYKPGVDAARLSTGFGHMGEAELILVAADPLEHGAIVGRVRESIGGMDVEVLGGRFRQRNFGGLAWEGDARIVGVWGELALFQRGSEPHRAGWSEAAFSGVAGVERNLPGDVMAGLGLFYHDFGARSPDELTMVAMEEPFLQGWTFLQSAGYAVVTAAHDVHPLVNISAAGLINLVDGSTLWQPRLLIRTGNNADLTAFGWIGLGPRPALEPVPRIRSEYGTVPTGGGLYARWFF